MEDLISILHMMAAQSPLVVYMAWQNYKGDKRYAALVDRLMEMVINSTKVISTVKEKLDVPESH